MSDTSPIYQSDTSPIYRLYAQQLWKENNMYGAWPPIVTEVDIGVFGLMTGNGFLPQGNLREHAGIEFTAVRQEGGPAQINLNSNSFSIKYFALQGSAWVATDEIAGSAHAKMSYLCMSDTNFSVVCSPLTQTAISESVVDYLRDTVWPAIKEEGKGGWNSNWRIVTNAYYSPSYVFVSSTQKQTQFEFQASGDALVDLGAGKISTAIGVVHIQNVGDAKSSYGASPPYVVGMNLWHFDSHGNPIEDQG